MERLQNIGIDNKDKKIIKVLYLNQSAEVEVALCNKWCSYGCISTNCISPDEKEYVLYSCYFPNDFWNTFEEELEYLDESINSLLGDILIAGDFYSKSTEWYSEEI